MGIIQSSFNQVASEAVKVGGVIKPLLEQTKLTPELLNKYADKLLAEQRNLNTSIQGIAKANELSTHLDEANDKPLSDSRDKSIDRKNVIKTHQTKSGQYESMYEMKKRILSSVDQDFIKQQKAIDNLNQLSLAKERQKIMKSIMKDSYKGGIK